MRYLILITLLAPLARALPILTNGSFETTPYTHTQNLAGPFTIAGWTGTASSQGGNAGLVIGPDNGLTPHDGARHYTFNGGNPSDHGWLQQIFTTTPGADYTLTFALGRAGGLQDLSLLAQLVATSVSEWIPLAEMTAQPPWSRTYQLHTLDFLALTDLTTLRFTDTSGPNSISDLYLDAIDVTEIPHPASRISHPTSVPDTGSTALLTLGALLLAWAARIAQPASRITQPATR